MPLVMDGVVGLFHYIPPGGGCVADTVLPSCRLRHNLTVN